MDVVLTGATSGVGSGAARLLARQGHGLVLVVRDGARGAQVAAELRALGSPRVAVVVGDLARLASVRAAVDTIVASHRVDVVLSCAGVLPWRRELTADGVEAVWAATVLGPCALALGLLPHLPEGGRIVMMGGDLHRFGRIAWDDPELSRGYSAWRAGTQAALAKTMWTLALGRRLQAEARGVTANVFCPGSVRSGLTRDFPAWLRPGAAVMQRFAQTPEQGAATPVALAVDEAYAGVSGRYFRGGRERAPAAAAADPAAQERLVALIAARIAPGART